MVQVKSSMWRSTEPLVNVEIKGINEAMLKIRQYGKDVSKRSEVELVRQGNFVQQEVQESIIGNRGEPKSVDTGDFANSIELDVSNLTGKNKQIVIYTTLDYPTYLEYGTTMIPPRRHFRNTTDRIKPQVVRALKRATGVKFGIGMR